MRVRCARPEKFGCSARLRRLTVIVALASLGRDRRFWDQKRFRSVELWELVSVGGTVLAVALEKIDMVVVFFVRVEASAADEEKPNEDGGYDGYYPANG